MKNILINLLHHPCSHVMETAWPVSQHKRILRMGNHPEIFRPALSRNDLNRINDQVFKYCKLWLLGACAYNFRETFFEGCV